MNFVTLVLGSAVIFTILSLILFLGKVQRKGKLGKALTTLITCIAVFFVFGACGVVPGKQQLILAHNEPIQEFYRDCKKNPNLKTLEDLQSRQLNEYVYVEEFTASKNGNRDIINVEFKIDLLYGLYITTSEKIDLAYVEVWD